MTTMSTTMDINRIIVFVCHFVDSNEIPCLSFYSLLTINFDLPTVKYNKPLLYVLFWTRCTKVSEIYVYHMVYLNIQIPFSNHVLSIGLPELVWDKGERKNEYHEGLTRPLRCKSLSLPPWPVLSIQDKVSGRIFVLQKVTKSGRWGEWGLIFWVPSDERLQRVDTMFTRWKSVLRWREDSTSPWSNVI